MIYCLGNGLLALASTLAGAAQENQGDAAKKTLPNLFDSPLLLFALLGFFLWMIVLRPQSKEKKERQRQLDSMKKGDKVVSIGGIHGKIAELDEAHGLVTVDVGSKVTLKFSKAAIQSVETKNTGKAPEEATGKATEQK